MNRPAAHTDENMNRPAAHTDFPVEVPGLGTCIFGRRTGRDRFKISAEFHRLTEGLNVGDGEFALAAEATATIKVLLVDGPEKLVQLLDLDAPADMDPGSDTTLLSVFFALRQKELSFRPGKGEVSEGSRQVDGEQPGVLVSQKVQPGAE